MLTRKMLELLLFIDQHTRESGTPPSYGEMAAAFGLKAKSGVHRLVQRYEELPDPGVLGHHSHDLEPDSPEVEVLAEPGVVEDPRRAHPHLGAQQ